MKQLTIIRHAKSSWNFDIEDRERPLSERGTRDAFLVSEYLKDHALGYDAFFSSPAKRAWETCNIIRSVLGIALEHLKTVNSLYDFEGTPTKAFVAAVPNTLESIAIFGHNPALMRLSNLWGSLEIDHMPTCSVVSITFDSDNWKDLKKGRTQLFITPKKLRPL